MKLAWLIINNYKSLRSIQFRPRSMSVLVGANASGKSNLADAFSFVSEVYRHGLPVAVARKGGFENMAFRKMRRSKGGIGFQVAVELTGKELRRIGLKEMQDAQFRFQHRFSFQTRGQSIRAEYEVVYEYLKVERLLDGGTQTILEVIRHSNGRLEIHPTTTSDEDLSQKAFSESRKLNFFDLHYFGGRDYEYPSSELFLSFLGRHPVLSIFVRAVSGVRVFQISPSRSREFGVPLPSAEMDVTGANLPSVVDLLKRDHPDAWNGILSVMRGILPNLVDINVEYTSMRTLSLLFVEEGFGRPWGVHEVSDGTVQSLALLVAIFDPRFTFLIVEEPENSVHPWIIRRIVSACADVAPKKQIVITTHSPSVINAVSPEDVYVVSRGNNGTQLSRLVDLEGDFLAEWSKGTIPTFEYLDSGAFPEALPPSPEV